MNQEYFCPVCGYVTHDSVLTGPSLGKNVCFVVLAYKEQAKIMIISLIKH